MNHLISLKEQTADDILLLLELAKRVKKKCLAGEDTNYLPNKTLIMLFQKTSTRTRLSFEAGMTKLGGHAIFLDSKTTQFSLTDFKDEIQAVMRFGDILMFRAIKATDVITAASYNRIPVIDGCSEKYHPAQALSDLFTMSESAGGIDKVKKIAWLGIENNVSNTLTLAATKLGIEVAIATPETDPASIDQGLICMAQGTGKLKKTTDIEATLAQADFVHTDTWMNMEFFLDGVVKPEYMEEYERRLRVFSPYQLNSAIIKRYAPNAKIMHCMPCHVGYEITRDAIDHPQSIIFNQAENRMHMQKAILMWLMGKTV